MVAIITGQSLQWLRRAFPKFTLVECEVAVNRELTKDPAQGSVRHIELKTAKPGKARANFGVSWVRRGWGGVDYYCWACNEFREVVTQDPANVARGTCISAGIYETTFRNSL